MQDNENKMVNKMLKNLVKSDMGNFDLLYDV